MKVAHVYISGVVQGVGYRNFVQHRARKMGISGWVRNLSDSRVEAMFAGKKEVVESMIRMLWKGSFLSNVESVVVGWEEEDTEFSGFERLKTQ